MSLGKRPPPGAKVSIGRGSSDALAIFNEYADRTVRQPDLPNLPRCAANRWESRFRSSTLTIKPIFRSKKRDCPSSVVIHRGDLSTGNGLLTSDKTAMSRSRAASHGVNLLPLLDVLLCTMGTLIVVLGVVNREARLHPTKHMSGKAAAVAAHNQELADAREDLELYIRQLSTAREKTLADLETARVRLSGIEDHSRQMEDQLRNLGAAGKQLESTDDQKDRERDALRSEVMQLNARRLQLEKDLQKARADAANRKPLFAVVPFEGVYQTSRRPIYIECRGDSVILQPEGIAFTPTDFMGPGGPGNPLAAALRAAQEYWRQAPAPAPGIPNEPYPLLLVRPDGIIAYYLVRDAMSSWDAEFGYEMIGADWKLDFPMQPEPRLKEMETRAVAEARDRLQWLAQNSPETFGRKSKTQYRMSSIRGGVARDGGPSLGNDPFADDPLGGFGKSAGGGTIPGGSGGAVAGGSNGTGTNGLGSLRGDSAFGTGASGNGVFGNGGPGNNGLAGGGFADRNSGSGLDSRGLASGGSGSSGLGQNGLGPDSAGRNGIAGDLGYGGPAGGGAGSTSNGTSGGGMDLSGVASNGMSGTGTGGGPELSAVGPRYAGNGRTSGFGGDPRSASSQELSGNNRTGGTGSPNRSEYGGVAWPKGSGDAGGTKFDGNSGGSAGSTVRSSGTGSSISGQLASDGGPSFNDIAGMRGGYGGDAGSSGSPSSSSSGGSSGNASSASGSMSSSGSMSGQGGSDSSSMSAGMPTPSLNFQSQNQQQRNSLAQSRSKLGAADRQFSLVANSAAHSH